MDIFSKLSHTASNRHYNSPNLRDTIIRKQKKEGIFMDNITSKVYNHMKTLSDQNGFAPILRQTADQMNLKVDEVEGAIDKMQQLGKIVVTEIPAKSIIEFVD